MKSQMSDSNWLFSKSRLWATLSFSFCDEEQDEADTPAAGVTGVTLVGALNFSLGRFAEPANGWKEKLELRRGHFIQFENVNK